MSRKNITAFFTVVAFICLPGLVLCQTTGIISGKVIDAKTSEPLPGANVLLEGTSIGASTDLDGNYLITNVPSASYTIKVTYIGYTTRQLSVRVTEGAHLVENLKMEAVGLKGREVVVTAQASGQNAAISQQLSAQNIVNVVSAARIQELPDANAAESVGRLPGVYLLRSGGEGFAVAIRGLQPKYNVVTIDGVQMASTSTGDRSVDLSMISSTMLSGIEVYKTLTPDMDAAVLGGVVNFEIRDARPNTTGAPEIELSIQGGYNYLQDAYNNSKIVGAIGDRFLNNRFGILAQGVVERSNLTSDVFGGNYYIPDKTKPQFTSLSVLNLAYNPRNRQRYDGTLTLDYKLPLGKIELMNLFSSGNTTTQTFSQTYNLLGNLTDYGVGQSTNKLTTVTNLLNYEQDLTIFKLDAKLSNSYSENQTPNNWNMSFEENPDFSGVSLNQNPQLIAQAAESKTNPSSLVWNAINLNNSISKQRDLTGSIDIERSINLSDLLTASIKLGGMYKNTYRAYSYGGGIGGLLYPGAQSARATIIKAFPWMAAPPYNIKPDGTQQLPITLFLDPNFSYGRFLGGNYQMGPGSNIGLISQVLNNVVESERPSNWTSGGGFQPVSYDNIAYNYAGNEYRTAEYIMATINIGTELTIIPGVRYQGLKTTYKATIVPGAGVINPWPQMYPHRDTTISEVHGFWLPDFNLMYKPLSWLGLHAAYTNTLTYPDFNSIIPIMDIAVSSITWNNYELKPPRSQNYDLALSVYDNSIGLFTVDGFLKRIDNLIFSQQTFITNPALYPGVPSYTKGYALSTDINNPFRVDVWGIETEWQTHFWYLPEPLNGIVLNVNYTHIFTSAKYPYTLTVPGTFPTYIPTHVDTFYTDRLVDQPNDIVNLSVGYDYKGFSVVVSMIYQANVFNTPNFFPALRVDKARYLRWDLSAKQDLPWFGLQAFLDVANINGESDNYLIEGPQFSSSNQDYGMRADVGLRWRLQ